MDKKIAVGSIAGGGRYDELVGIFSRDNIPSVGFSIGIERIFTIMEAQANESGGIRENQTQVYLRYTRTFFK